MKTPAFWSEPNFLSRLLKPLGTVYAFATRLRIGLGRPCKIGRPVVCIGNLTAGGTGKTPVAVAVAGLLQQAGKNPFFVSRGYGGTLKNIMVDKEKHTASEVGDEPLLLAGHRSSSTLIVLPAPRRPSGPVPKLLSWTTVSRIRDYIKICPFWFLTAVSASATACRFRPDRSAKTSPPASNAPMRQLSSVRTNII